MLVSESPYRPINDVEFFYPAFHFQVYERADWLEKLGDSSLQYPSQVE